MMIDGEHDETRLNELLRSRYDELRRIDPARREAVLSQMVSTVVAERAAGPRLPTLRWGWIAAAACAVLAIAVWSTRGPSLVGTAYGIDDVPGRMAEVHSIVLRGVQWVPDKSGHNRPPLAIPIEIVVKRPGMFRHTVSGVSFNKERADVRLMTRLCDGRHEWILDESGKLLGSAAVSPLDARLKTESIAQITAVLAVLGPAQASYRKVGHEQLDGRPCDLYEATFPGNFQSTVAHVWIERSSGLPIRVIRDEVGADRKVLHEMELNEISINTPLDDDLFRPKDRVLTDEANALRFSNDEVSPANNETQRLDAAPTSSGSAGGAKLEAWYALQIADKAALVVWRRSAPAAGPDGKQDWLANMQLELHGSTAKRAVRHAWLHQSGSADKWNWSLVVPVDGKQLGRDSIHLALQSGRGSMSIELPPLRFRDDDLQKLLRAARLSTLGAGTAEMPLATVRARAKKLWSLKGVQ
jgi:hypothetical protein